MPNRAVRVFTLIAAGALATAAPVRAAQPGAIPMTEEKFVMEAANVGLMEVELGRLAATHASSDRVKQFGKRMVDDHTKANAELKALAAQKSIALPRTLDAEHRTEVDRLSKLHGAEFDRAYMQMMVDDHKQDVEKFRERARSSDDPDVKAFASKTLPTLESHLQMAQDISGAKGSPTAGAPAGRPGTPPSKYCRHARRPAGSGVAPRPRWAR